MTAAERAERTARADALVARTYRAAGGPEEGACVVAVGGYGRGELAPYSDLDVVLLHRDGLPGVAGLAERLWYPLWDAGVALDHAVRAVGDLAAAADADLRVRLGLLDLRPVAGDVGLARGVRAELLAEWRREARRALPALRLLVEERHQRVGELAHASVPDLKEAEGGLRDAAVLGALTATWLVDLPHVEVERCRTALLDLRDLVQARHGRGNDRVGPELWADLAADLGLPDEAAAQRQVRSLGRRMTHLSRLTWRRVAAVIDAPSPTGRRPGRPGPRLETIDRGVATHGGEVVVAAGIDVRREPLLLLRCAAQAAERELAVNPAAVARLIREAPRLPEPWPAEARDLWVRLLAAPGLLPVWETLEETGALATLLPEWERIRLLPHGSSIHRYTVDRHVIETCREAAQRIRRVARPDLLLVAALLHDIGKGGRRLPDEPMPHSEAGAAIAASVALRMGFEEADAATIVTLVRHHLLLAETATTRDLDDPATALGVAARIGDLDTLELLRVLAEADALAASAAAWTRWRAGLVDRLADRVRELLTAGVGGFAEPAGSAGREGSGRSAAGLRRTRPVSSRPVALPAVGDEVVVNVSRGLLGTEVEFAARDRVGLLADAAATLAWQRCDVRAAQAWSQGEWGCSRWQLADLHEEVDARLLEQRFAALAAGRLDLPALLNRPARGGLPSVVSCHPEASSRATVVEVRAEDRPGLVYAVLAAIAAQGLMVSSAHISTVGPQAVDVFYVHQPGAGPLSPARAAMLVARLEEALRNPGTPA